MTLSANTSYMCLPITIRIAAGATLEFYVDAGTVNTCFVSYSISEVGSVPPRHIGRRLSNQTGAERKDK